MYYRKTLDQSTTPQVLIEKLLKLAITQQGSSERFGWTEILKSISSDEDVQTVLSLSDPKTSVCGKRIEQRTLSFQCFDCAPDPHHMFCVSCFELPKHKGHRFIMRHNIGGCCDCGDDKTIDPKGACINHAGYQYMNKDQELQKIPKMLQESIKNFIKLLVEQYSALVLEVNLNYPIYLLKAKHYLEKFGIDTKKIDQLIGSENMQKASKQQQGVYLYNIFVDFTINIVKQRMPMIILITEALMDRVNNQSEDTYLDLIVKSAAAIDGGHVDSKDMDEIMFTFHANPVFKNLLLQTLLKQYHNLKVLRMEPRGRAVSQFLKTDKQFQELPQERRQLLYSNPNVRQQFINFIEGIIVKEEKYIQQAEQTDNKQKQRKLVQIEYRAELHSHHTQFVSIEHQTDFFQSNYLWNYFGQLRDQYANITQYPMDDFGLILNTLYWLVLRTEYVFFPQIYEKSLMMTLGEEQFQTLKNLNSFQTQFSTGLAENVKKTFYGLFLSALQAQQPAKLFLTNLFKKDDEASLLTIHYLFIQSNAIGVWVGSFLKTLNKNQDSQFRLNLLLIHAQICFQYIHQRNNQQGDLPKIRNLAYIAGKTDPNSRLQYRLFMMNASSLDRIFVILLVNCYFESGLSRIDFREYITKHFGIGIKEFLSHFAQIVGRALQSFFSISYSEISNDVTLRIYGGKQNQQCVNLLSTDLAAIKMYLFLGDQDEIDNFAQMLEEQSFSTQDQQMVKHDLILDLLLGDMDLLNVSGLLFQKLPTDIKNFFQKYIRSIFMSQTYQSFTNLKQIFMGCGLLKQLPLADYLLEVCDLDPFIRELKLKPEFHDKPLYEPHILSEAHELVGQITENLMSKKDSKIDLFFGNGLDFDLSLLIDQARGPIKFQIIQSVVANKKLFQKLFGDYSSVDLTTISFNHKKTLAKTLYVFLKTNIKYNFYSEAQINLLAKIKDSLMMGNGTQQIGSEEQKVENTQNIFTKLEQLFLGNSQEEPQVLPQNQGLDSKKQEMMMKRKQALMKKFQKEQQKFQQNFQDITDLDQDSELDQCQQCKLPIENNQVTSLPAMIAREQISDFERYGVPEKLVVLQSCKHKFHHECLSTHLKNVMYRVKLFHSSCPICRQGINIVSNLLKNITEPDQLELQIQRYKEKIIEYVNFNFDVCDDISKKYESFNNKEQVFNNLVFMEMNLRCIASLFMQLFQTPVDFLNKEKGAYELTANLVFMNQRFLRQDNFKDLSNDQIFNSLIQNYSSNGLIGRLINIMLAQALNIQVLYDSPLLLSNEESQVFEIANQIIQNPLLINQQLGNPQPNDLTRIQEENLNKQGQQIQIAKSTIGENFKQFYLNYFPNGCSKCKFFPIDLHHDGFAEQYLCIKCYQSFCSGRCQKEGYHDLGNLNEHAVKDHCGQAIYISLITGFVTLVLSPISIIDHKNLFYDKMGQKIKLLEAQIDWSDYIIDDRELQNAYDILKENRISQIICSNFGSDKPRKIDTNGSL